MNAILLFDDDFIAVNRVCLRGRRLQHVRTVHRAGVGDELRVGLLNAQLGHGVVTTCAADRIELEVTLNQPPPAALPVTLVLALPRPKSLKRVLQAITAMGVKRIVLLNTWRVEKSFWESPALHPASLREQFVLGLEQSRDTVLPQITLQRRFKPFAEDNLPALIADTHALLAHPAAHQPCPRDVQRTVTLAVGPEGGFIDYEVEMLMARGFEAVSLSERPLRVEHAVPALLGRLF